MYPFLFQYGDFKISSYGVMLALAFIVGVWLAKKNAKNEFISEQSIDSISLWLIVAGVFGSRFLYTFVEHSSEYLEKPWRFFNFQEGGLSFSGGLVLAIGAAIFFCKRNKISFWKMADALSPSLALGFSIAKIGCFLMGCCHGKRCDLPWGVIYTHPESLAHPKGLPLHPSQIYESISTFVIFGGLMFLYKRKPFDGAVFAALLFSYGIIRFLLEYFRGEVGYLGFFTTAQTINIPIVVLSIAIWAFLRKKD